MPLSEGPLTRTKKVAAGRATSSACKFERFAQMLLRRWGKLGRCRAGAAQVCNQQLELQTHRRTTGSLSTVVAIWANGWSPTISTVTASSA